MSNDGFLKVTPPPNPRPSKRAGEKEPNVRTMFAGKESDFEKVIYVKHRSPAWMKQEWATRMVAAGEAGGITIIREAR